MGNFVERAVMTKPFQKYAKILLDNGFSQPLDYGIDSEKISLVEKGTCVQVPVRGVLRLGIVIELVEHSKFDKVLPIHQIVHDKPLITKPLFELALWISRYYQTPLSKVIKLFSPKAVRKDIGHKEQKAVRRKKTLEELRNYCIGIRQKKPAQAKVIDEMLKVEKEIFLSELLEKAKVSRSSISSLVKEGLLELLDLKVSRNPLEKAEYFPSKPKKLNPEQTLALSEIQKSLQSKTFSPYLLYGVTGSGKTEVYMQAIDYALSEQKQCLMLVPEIALTTQTIEKFKSRFKDQIAVLHHRLSDGERFDVWHDIRNGKVSIVIGARSAIFAPLDHVGLIIVDEEHESSYKQNEEMPTYHARDVAVMRAKMQGATVVLGTATPSLESYHNVLMKKYTLLEMPSRVNSKALPKIELIDMKREQEKAKGFTLFSSSLLDEIKKRYQRGEQSLLFLNRRGYHTSLLCPECGYIEKCPHCEISLTFHRKRDLLTCHLCDYQIKPPRSCRDCKKEALKFKGVGTENVETQLRKIFPEIRTLRMDSDTTKHQGSYEKLYYNFRNQKADVLIGTQMIAKGLHFPNVTLVGILNCDQQLNLPDFKASETTFQMIMQVSGRAGRGELDGKVIIQTFHPENTILSQAKESDYLSFYQREVESRKFFHYPPFTHLIKLVFKGKDEKKTESVAKKFYQKLSWIKGNNAEVFEPLPCGYPKIKEVYRFQILMKGNQIYLLNQYIERVKAELQIPKSIRILVDVDPSSTFF